MTTALTTPPASATLTPAPNAPATVASDLLGPLRVEPSSLIAFPAGLFGFPECRAFVLLPTARDGVYWLQSADHAALTFVLIDPFRVVPEFAVELSAVDLAELHAGEASTIAILAIVTLPSSRAERPTANLQGALALNLAGGYGKQLASADSPFGLRHAFELPA